MDRTAEVSFIAKGNWLIFFLKEGKKCIPVVESGQEEGVMGSTFMCFRVVTGDSGNDGHVCKVARNPKRVAPCKLKVGV